MDRVNDKCTGMKTIDWSDSLQEWFRSTWTLQDDPCKHFGQGISEFLRALFKDLPVTLQIPVVRSILVFLYGVVQAAFQYGITAPLGQHHRDPPSLAVEQSQSPQLTDVDHYRLVFGDAP